MKVKELLKNMADSEVADFDISLDGYSITILMNLEEKVKILKDPKLYSKCLEQAIEVFKTLPSFTSNDKEIARFVNSLADKLYDNH